MLTLSDFCSYLSFENSIQTEYVTEKLFTALLLPLVPVFYGSPHTPNITTTPSFIRASDFATPAQLAAYLAYLDDHPAEYAKYSRWRSKGNLPNAFTQEYLRALQYRSVGPREVKLHRYVDRTAQCCRLCDEKYLQWASQRPKVIIPPRMAAEEIDAKFFSGTLSKFHVSDG